MRALSAQLRRLCPWDREQTIEKVRDLVIEEARELRAAIGKKDWANACEEVGDTLFNLLLLTRIAEERGLFTWDAACDGAAAKMIRRHPHVFGKAKAATAAEAIARFNAAKARERRRPDRSKNT